MANEIDEIAESSGRTRLLIPALNSGIDKIGLREKVESALDKVGYKKVEDLNKLNKDKKNDLLKQVAAE
jgi:hypothetical protein